MGKIAANVYGDAWFSYAEESGRLDELYEETGAVLEVFRQHKDLQKLLCAPTLSMQQKAEVLDGVLKNRIDEHLLSFLKILVEKNHFRELETIAAHFQSCYKQYRNIGVVSIRSATVLNAAQREKIESRILELTSYESLEPVYEVEPELIGGLVIRIQDRVVDSSIKTKLERMKQQLEAIQL